MTRRYRRVGDVLSTTDEDFAGAVSFEPGVFTH